MADILYSGGGHFDVYANDKKIVPFQECPLERCLLGVNSAMYAENDCGIAHLASETLGVRIYGGAGISMAKVMQGKLLAYFFVYSTLGLCCSKNHGGDIRIYLINA